MRHFRRSFQSKTSRILIFAVALSVLAGLCALSPPANGQAAAGTANTLPAAWRDAVKTLADRVAASVSPAHPVALTVKNISSVGASDVDALRAAIDATAVAERDPHSSSATRLSVRFCTNRVVTPSC